MGRETLILQLEQFEGPYDLLLELARQEKLDLSHISLGQVTDSFLAYVKQGDIPPELLADFLVVAATLLLMKIRAALPDLNADEEEEVAELTDRIHMYQLYREQADYFRARWGQAPLLPANFSPVSGGTYPGTMPAIDGHDLAAFFSDLLGRLPKLVAPTAHLILRGRTLSESLQLLTHRLAAARKILFHEAMRGESPQNTAVSFLAALEMARQNQVALHQDAHFENITIERI
ncbi:MAG: segregation/condensation protein A [Candidatus Andersenbacteria bacterium]|nr:segregation/condensation protein A [Candidatus Andersenbacteria bacterium]